MPQHHADAIIPWILALDPDRARDRDCDRDRDHDHDCGCLTMAPGHYWVVAVRGVYASTPASRHSRQNNHPLLLHDPPSCTCM